MNTFLISCSSKTRLCNKTSYVFFWNDFMAPKLIISKIELWLKPDKKIRENIQVTCWAGTGVLLMEGAVRTFGKLARGSLLMTGTVPEAEAIAEFTEVWVTKPPGCCCCSFACCCCCCCCDVSIVDVCVVVSIGCCCCSSLGPNIVNKHYCANVNKPVRIKDVLPMLKEATEFCCCGCWEAVVVDCWCCSSFGGAAVVVVVVVVLGMPSSFSG